MLLQFFFFFETDDLIGVTTYQGDDLLKFYCISKFIDYFPILAVFTRSNNQLFVVEYIYSV